MEYDFSFDLNEYPLGIGEEIIAKDCTILVLEQYESEEYKEVIDFSRYNFDTNKGFIFFGYYYPEKHTSIVEIYTNCCVSQKKINEVNLFNWWNPGQIINSSEEEDFDEVEF